MDTVLSQYGLAGVVISAMAGVIFYQNKKLEGLYKEKDQLQEQRRQDTIDIFTKNTEMVQEFNTTSKLLLAKLSGEKQ